jgi:hypothetical protein
MDEGLKRSLDGKMDRILTEYESVENTTGGASQVCGLGNQAVLVPCSN